MTTTHSCDRHRHPDHDEDAGHTIHDHAAPDRGELGHDHATEHGYSFDPGCDGCIAAYEVHI